MKISFDLMHGRNNLDKATDLLDKNNREDLDNFLIIRYHLIHIICLYANQRNYYNHTMMKFFHG